jgi:hypothetical protein
MRTSDRLPEECREEIRTKLVMLRAEADKLEAIGDGHESHHKHIRIRELAWVLGEDDQ